MADVLMQLALDASKGWLGAAGWLADEGGEDLRDGPFSGAIRIAAVKDCRTFVDTAVLSVLGAYLQKAPPGDAGPKAAEYLGHDLYLTQHGHGSGFWDRDWLDTEHGEHLSSIAREMPERAVYVDAMGMVTCD